MLAVIKLASKTGYAAGMQLARRKGVGKHDGSGLGPPPEEKEGGENQCESSIECIT